MPPRWPREAPTSPREAPRCLKISQIGLKTAPRSPPEAARCLQDSFPSATNNEKHHIYLCFLQVVEAAPKKPQDSQDNPRTAPRRAQDAPRTPQDAPRERARWRERGFAALKISVNFVPALTNNLKSLRRFLSLSFLLDSGLIPP